MANRQDDHAPLDDFFSGFDKDEKKPSGEKAEKANKVPSHIQPSTRSGILSLFGTRKPAARKGHNVAMQPEALEVRQVLTTTTNPLAAWQNAPGAPADAIGNLNPYPNAFMYDINISPDGTRLATAGSNKEIHIINVQSGQIEQTLIGHSSLVMEVDFSPDGTKLVSASYDKTARIWDVQSGALLQTITLPQLGLRVDWSPRGDMVAIGVHVNVTQLYNVATGAVTSVSYPGNTEAVIFDFTEDGNHILHTNGTNVTMHDTATGALVKTFTGVNAPIYSVDVDPTGTYVAAGTLNGKVLVWDMATGALKSDQSIHVGGSVKSVQFMTGGSPHLVSADYTNKIIVQNIEGLASGNPLVEVKRYIVPNPDSIVASNTGGEFFVRTGDNTGATYITAYDAPDPPEPPAPEPEPEPEPELPAYGPEEAEEAESELASQILDLLSEEAIPYARGYLTVDSSDYYYSHFHVRFRNPGDQTFIEAITKYDGQSPIVSSETLNHAGGTEDNTWLFRLDRRSNQFGGVVTINIYADASRTQLLDHIEAYYHRNNNTSQIFTEQPAWDAIEQGRNAESPIDADLSVVSIQGVNVISSFRSPSDQSVVAFEGAGILGTQNVAHEGGTTFNLSMVTFNVRNATGNYALRLYERAHGRMLDEVWLHWDQGTKSLTLLDPNDVLAADAPENTPGIMDTFNALLSIDDAYVGDKQINWIEQMRMYHSTADLPGGLNFTTKQADDYVLEKYPYYKEENWQAEIMRRYNADPSYTIGQYETSFHHNRLELINQTREQLGTYEEAMGQIMQFAVDIFIQLRNGADQQILLTQLDSLIAQWNDEDDIGGLTNFNIHIPGRDSILEAARMILDTSWSKMLQAEDSYRDYLEYCDTMREGPLRQNAYGEWVAITQGDPSDIPETMSRRQISLSLRIYDALAASQDPRIAGLTPKAKQALALAVGLRAEDNWEQNINQTVAIANEIIDTGMGGSDIEPLPGETELSDAAKQARAEIRMFSQQEIFNQAQDWYTEIQEWQTRPDYIPFRQAFSIRLDTIAGQIMLGAAEQLIYATTDLQKWNTAIRLQMITDIDAREFILLLQNNPSQQSFINAFKELLIRAQYEHLFGPYQIYERPYPISAHPNIPASSNESYANEKPVRIRLDAATHGMAIVGVEAVLNGATVAYSQGSLFIDIPMEKFVSCKAGIIVGLKIKLINGSILFIESDPFNVSPNPLLGTIHNLSTNSNTERAAIENKILNQIKQNPPINLEAGDWRLTIGSGYHRDTTGNHAFHAIDLNLGSGNFDKGQPVKAVADGVVYENKRDTLGNTTLIIKHEIDLDNDGVNETVWYSKYLHIQKLDYDEIGGDALTDLTVGTLVTGGETIVEVGKESNNPLMSAHLHFEILDELMQSIDLSELLTSENGYNISTATAMSGGADGDLNTLEDNTEKAVSWDRDLNMWVNKTEGLIYDRSPQSIGETSAHWIAFATNIIDRQRIIWKKTKYMDDNNILQDAEIWVNISGTHRWNGSNFVPLFS